MKKHLSKVLLVVMIVNLMANLSMFSLLSVNADENNNVINTVLYSEAFWDETFVTGEYTTQEQLQILTDAGWMTGGEGSRYGIASYNGGDKYLKIARIDGYPSIFYDLDKPIRVNGAPLPYNSTVIDPGHPGKNAKLIVEYDMYIAKSTESGYRYAFIGMLPPENIDPNYNTDDLYITKLGFERDNKDELNPIAYKGNDEVLISDWENKSWHNYKTIINITDEEGRYISNVDIYVDGQLVQSGLPFAYINEDNDYETYPRDVALVQRLRLSTLFSGSFKHANAGLGIDNIEIKLQNEGAIEATSTPVPDGVMPYKSEFVNEDFEDRIKYPLNMEYTVDNGLVNIFTGNGWTLSTTGAHYGITKSGSEHYAKISKTTGTCKLTYTFPQKVRINANSVPDSYTGEDPGHPGNNAVLRIKSRFYVNKSSEDNYRYALMNLGCATSNEKAVQIGYEQQNKDYTSNPIVYKGSTISLSEDLEFGRLYDIKVLLKITDAQGNYVSLADVYVDDVKVMENQPMSFSGTQGKISIVDKIEFTTNFSSSFNRDNPGMGIDYISVDFYRTPEYNTVLQEDFENMEKYSVLNSNSALQMTTAGWSVHNTNANYYVTGNDNKYLKLSANGNTKALISIPLSKKFRINNNESETDSYDVVSHKDIVTQLKVEYDLKLIKSKERNRLSTIGLTNSLQNTYFSHTAGLLSFANKTPHSVITALFENKLVYVNIPANQWNSVCIYYKLTGENHNYISKADVYLNDVQIATDMPISYVKDYLGVSVIDSLTFNTNIVGNGINETASGMCIDNIEVTYITQVPDNR